MCAGQLEKLTDAQALAVRCTEVVVGNELVVAVVALELERSNLHVGKATEYRGTIGRCRQT